MAQHEPTAPTAVAASARRERVTRPRWPSMSQRELRNEARACRVWDRLFLRVGRRHQGPQLIFEGSYLAPGEPKVSCRGLLRQALAEAGLEDSLPLGRQSSEVGPSFAAALPRLGVYVQRVVGAITIQRHDISQQFALMLAPA